MSTSTSLPDDAGQYPVGHEPDNPRLDRWLERSMAPLDLLALCTIWLTMIPLGSLHQVGSRAGWWYAARIGISLVYLADMVVRTSLAHRRLHYVVSHPVGVLSIFIPAIRLIFSLRLLRAMFRKGNLGHFLVVSAILMLNFTVIVYGFEHRDASANIDSLGVSVWWAFVTFFTVGYGDYFPVTTGGRTFAVLLMALGLVVAAVITAQIASTFMDQAAARRAASSGIPGGGEAASVDGPTPNADALARIESKLDRIERAFERDRPGGD